MAMKINEYDGIEKEYMAIIDEMEIVQQAMMTVEVGSVTHDTLSAKNAKLYDRSRELEDQMWFNEPAGTGTSSVQDIVMCPNCQSVNVFCDWCGDDPGDCACVLGGYYCGSCSHAFKDKTWNEPQSMSDFIAQNDSILELKGNYKGPTTPVTPVYTKDCKHLHDKITLADGTVVHCTSQYQSGNVVDFPDFGLYADQSWVRACKWRNEMVNWPDMQLPNDYDLALKQIEDAYNRAVAGQDVDLGCIGAHGRTGTMLAIMYVISTNGSADGPTACQWVWDNYCKHAIETKTQEWFVSYAAGVLYGYDIPEKPVYKTGTSGICLPVNHYAMHKAGRSICKTGIKCNWWERDMEELRDHGKIAGVAVSSLEGDDRYQALLKEYAIDPATELTIEVKEAVVQLMLGELND